MRKIAGSPSEVAPATGFPLPWFDTEKRGIAMNSDIRGYKRLAIVFVVALFIGSGFAMMSPVSKALSPPAPVQGNVVVVPVTLVNTNNNVSTPLNYTYGMEIPWANYSAYLNSNVSNVRFFGSVTLTISTELPGWIQNNDNNTANFSKVWINLRNTVIPANSNLTVYMVILNKSVSWNSTYWGIAPQLSANYGQYDNGAQVFPLYDNFSGSSLSSKWMSFNAPGSNFSVFNGIKFTANNGNYVSLASMETFSSPMTVDAYVSGASSMWPNIGLYWGNSLEGFGMTFYSSSSAGFEVHPTNFLGSMGSYGGNWRSGTSGTIVVNSPLAPGVWQFNYSANYQSGMMPGVSYVRGPYLNYNTTLSGNSEVVLGLLSDSTPGGTFNVSWVSAHYSMPNITLPPTYGVALKTFPVTFQENGLPSGTNWTVNINGQHGPSSTSSSITLELSNGSYVYTATMAGRTYDANPGVFNVTGSPVTVQVNFALTTYNVTFMETGLPSGTSWNVTIPGVSNGTSTTGSISLLLESGSYTFTVATADKSYHASGYSFTVSGANRTVDVNFTAVTYNVTFMQTGLPSGTPWSVNLSTGIHNSSSSASMGFRLTNGTYSYTILTINKKYNATGGTFQVNGTSVDVNVTFVPVTYAVTFHESGLPAGTLWSVIVNTTSNGTSSNNNITIQLMNGSYSFRVITVNKTYHGTGYDFNVSGSNRVVNVTFSTVTYDITFNESGLPSGTSWTVTISGGAGGSSSTSYISLALTNGSYDFTIATSNKTYHASGYSFSVSGSGRTVDVNFSKVTYKVSFVESGLSSGTTWSVTLNGNKESSSSSTITFTIWNGTYSYSAAGVSGFYINSHEKGSVTVDGSGSSVKLKFIPYSYIAGTINPKDANVTINGQNVQTHNGAFNYTVKNGTFSIEISYKGYKTYYDNVTVTSGQQENLNVSLTAIQSGTQSPGLSNALIYTFVGVVAIAVIATVGFVFMRRGKK